MDNRQVVLKVVLDALGVSDEIATIDDRKRVQKTIYLAQGAGVDLGYSYGWYILGPYSTDLARDYYGLAQSIAAGEGVSGRSLRDEAAKRLEKILPLMDPPKDTLAQEDWLELLASLHFLRTVSRKSQTESLEVMKTSPKVRLVPFAGLAEEKLRSSGLL